MPEPGIDRLGQAMRGLTIGTVESMRDFDRKRRMDGLQEIEEQIHIVVSGRAEEFADWDTTLIEFETKFVDATGQRSSAFDRPHFTYGAVILTGPPLAIVACVTDWKTTGANETVGAKVAVGCLATDKAAKFKADVHLSFQGFGSSRDMTDQDLGPT
jgi:hypothetical protein